MSERGFLRKDCENTLNILGRTGDLFEETVKGTENLLALACACAFFVCVLKK